MNSFLRVYKFTVIVAVFVIAVSCAPTPSPTPSPSPTLSGPALQAALEKIRDEYMKQLEASGFTPTWVPEVRVEYTPGLIWTGQRLIHVADWASLPDNTRQEFDGWASHVGEGTTTKQLFEEMFNWFFVAHEIGHVTQSQMRISLQGSYYTEINANEWAVAFWKTQPECQARLAWVERATRRIWERLPNPVPPGENPQAYFNREYRRLGTGEIPGYGYYQLKMIIDVIDRRQEIDFRDMVQAALKKPVK